MSQGWIQSWFGMAVFLASSLAVCADRAEPAPTTRADLIGAWRLVRIEVKGPTGAEPDPFYGEGSEGLLIYDASGWFSAQIMGKNRPPGKVPLVRPQAADASADAHKALVLDSYYAYYGTWTFDATTSTVTHRAHGALYPAEEHAVYAQRVEVHGSTMTFTRSQGGPDHPTVQTKVWERSAPP